METGCWEGPGEDWEEGVRKEGREGGGKGGVLLRLKRMGYSDMGELYVECNGNHSVNLEFGLKVCVRAC